MGTHTEGPWIIHPRFPEYIVPASHAVRPVGSAGDPERDRKEYAQQIVIIGREHRHRSRAEQSANARLIAASPELLSALVAITESGIDSVGDIDLHALIYKAKGAA